MHTTKAVILEVMAWAADNLDTELSVEALARRAGYSTPYFSRAFAAVVGEGPAAWVLARRIEQAADRLSAGSDRVLDVALECGFNDVTTFERAFRRSTGLTPSAFRKAKTGTTPEIDEVETCDRVLLPGFRLSGLAVDVTKDAAAPAALWQRLTRLLSEMELDIAPEAFRQVAFWQGDPERRFTCIAGFVDDTGTPLPLPFISIDVPEATCRRFVVSGGTDRIAAAYETIYSTLMPKLHDWPAGNFVCEIHAATAPRASRSGCRLPASSVRSQPEANTPTRSLPGTLWKKPFENSASGCASPSTAWASPAVM